MQDGRWYDNGMRSTVLGLGGLVVRPETGVLRLITEKVGKDSLARIRSRARYRPNYECGVDLIIVGLEPILISSGSDHIVDG